jgi:PKD-like domain
MKNLFIILFFFSFAAVNAQQGQEWESNAGECFCCENQGVYNLPRPPAINYTPSGHTSFPTAICPCKPNVFSTNKCKGATFTWGITPATVTFSGQGTASITVSNATLTPTITSITVNVTIKCGQKTVTNSKVIPVLQGCNTVSDPVWSLTMPTPTGPGTLTASGTCPDFGQGWTLKEYPIGTITSCTWMPGPILAQNPGSSFTFASIVPGKSYTLNYYVQRCDKIWTATCAKVKTICFTVYNPSTSRVASQFANAKSKSLGNSGLTVAYFESEFSINEFK